ncbi:MAG: hypothetical protein NXY57DRAFT_969883 [Lentinula lateritia]|nr:MAG: hypothetical protein NXY57DRAFT_969883 [Lentinula lateritia]
MPFLDIDIQVHRESETHDKIQRVSSSPIANHHRVHSIRFHPNLPTHLTPYEDCPVCSTDDQCVHRYDGVFTIWTDILPLFASLHHIEMSFVRPGIAVYDALSNIRNPFTLIITDCVIPLPPIQRSCDLLCDNLQLARNDWEVIVHRTHSFDFAFIGLCENLTTLDLTFDDRIHGSRQTTIDHISPLTTTLRSLTLRSVITSPRALTSFIDSMLAAVVQNIIKVHIIIEPDHHKVTLPTNLSHLTNASNLTTLALKVDNDVGSFPYLPSLKRLSIDVSTDPSYLLHLIPMFFTGLCHLELGTFRTDNYLDLCIRISHSRLQFIPTLCDLKILTSSVNRDTNSRHIDLLFRPWLSTAPNLQNINFSDSVYLRRSKYHWITSTAHV